MVEKYLPSLVGMDFLELLPVLYFLYTAVYLFIPKIKTNRFQLLE